MIESATRSEYFLDRSNATIANDRGEVGQWRWCSVIVEDVAFLALVLAPGESLCTPSLAVTADTVLFCRLAPAVNPALRREIAVDFRFEPEDGPPESIVSLPLRQGPTNYRTIEVNVSSFTGRVGCFSLTCSANDGNHPIDWIPSHDWIAVTDVAIGNIDRIRLLQARTNQEHRLQNELAHFSTVYQDDFYNDRLDDDPAHVILVAENDGLPPFGSFANAREIVATDVWSAPYATPLDGENAYNYAHRVLAQILPSRSPNFPQRLADATLIRDPVRILSLCSGAASIELALVRTAARRPQITLFDINAELLERAKRSLAPYADVIAVVGDVNAIDVARFENRFDIVLCVSGLHHVVELEHVVATTARLLADGGEFWTIGEAIGRDGNRLWPSALEAANAAFSPLPERYRFNHLSKTTDLTLPNQNTASSTFEGIRSSEIEQVLLAHLDPVGIYRRNCFLWRLVNMCYAANYDVANESDRRQLIKLVVAEYGFWKAGGPPNESYGVYRKR